MNDLDLFGSPIPDNLPKPTKFGKKKRDETPKGYAAKPGSGPSGQTCKTCRHFVRKVMGKTYFKCWLMNRVWTGGYGTDIRANSPACQHWATPQQIDPEATSRQTCRTFYVKH